MNVYIPAEFGGSDLSCMTSCVIAEELAYGCTGIQTALAVTDIGVHFEIMIFFSTSSEIEIS